MGGEPPATDRPASDPSAEDPPAHERPVGGEGPGGAGGALRYDRRPADHTPVHTADLPPTPTRDRNIVASAWAEAPTPLLTLGDDLPDRPVAEYKRRIGRWLLWRAGPAAGGDARYWAGASDDLAEQHTFRLFPDGNGDGFGPSGATHTRFRSWKEDLLGRAEPLTTSRRAP
ncbi:MAG: hypothetical protein JWM12_2762 [Ilumatobacteraceae bacterium]|nr:hypothetical protein [Ilumatobacteraceae bacterium]